MAGYEEEVLQLENIELPINTDEEMVEEVETENIEVPFIGDEERVDELVDEELFNNNSARDEEDILRLQNDELRIYAAGERVEEVTWANIAVIDKDLENMPAAAKDHVVDEIVECDEHITEVATKKSDVVIDDNNMMVISFVDHEAGDRDSPNIDDDKDASSGQKKKRKYGSV